MTGPLPPAMALLSQELNRMKADIASLKRQLRTSQLGVSSIENGALTINDGTGSPQIVVGLQPDGTFAHVAVGTNQPDQPSDPILSVAIGAFYVIWDGTMADGTAPLSDFLGVQVHCSATAGFVPSEETLQGTMTGQGVFGLGGLNTNTVYYVQFAPVTTSGVVGQFSNQVSAETDSAADQIPTGSIQGVQIAANTITAANIAAGTVVAGIVDATTIQAPTLVSSIILGYGVAPRGPQLFDFEAGAQGWGLANGTSAVTSTAWASTGATSLLLTASGTGQPQATSATGVFGTPCSPFDPVSMRADMFAPAALSHVYIGIQFFDVNGNLLQEVDCSDTVFAAGAQMTLTLATNAPASAAFMGYVFGDHATDGSGVLLYGDNIQISGNLAFSASSLGGIDSLGNVFDQGIEINGVSGLFQAFTVQDAWGVAVLASVDSQGDVTGQIVSATQDFVLQGTSMANTIIPGLAQGLIVRGGVANSSLPAPATPTSSEFYLYEIDFQATAGRHYLIVVESFQVTLSGAGKILVTLYGTTDGSNPTNASPVLAEVHGMYPAATANFNVVVPPLVHPIDSTSGNLWRLLVSVNSNTTGGGAPTMQIVQVDHNPGDDAELNNNVRVAVYDMGLNLPKTGREILSTSVGTGGTKNFTKTYTATASYSYQGSDGPTANARINSGGPMYQGGNVANTATGKSKTWIVFNSTQIASDLSGATIQDCKLTLRNIRTWFSTGMTVSLGWDTKTVFGTTATDPSGANIGLLAYAQGQGQTLTFDIGTAFATAFQSSSATSLVLFVNANALGDFGEFSGPNDSTHAPVLTIKYTK